MLGIDPRISLLSVTRLRNIRKLLHVESKKRSQEPGKMLKICIVQNTDLVCIKVVKFTHIFPQFNLLAAFFSGTVTEA
jgi:hypothetical protein